MARLPQPGGDQGVWGDILNDFLLQAHNSDGSLKDIPQSKIEDLATDLAAKQPLNANLTSIAGLSTTAYGRSLLTTADAAALRSTAGADEAYFQVFGVAAPTGVAATDSAAIQAAITACAAAGGGTVMLKAGTYVLGTTQITFPIMSEGSLVLRGQGVNTTIVTYNGSDYAFLIGDGGGTDTRWTFIENMSIKGASATPIGAVKINHSRFCGLRRVAIEDFTNPSGIGVLVTAGVHNYFAIIEHCRFRNSPTGLKLASSSGLGANSNTVRDCWFGVSSTAALHIDEADNNLIERCEFNGSNAIGAKVENNAIDNTFVKCTFDGPTLDVSISSAAVIRTIFIGCAGSTITDNGTDTLRIGGSLGKPLQPLTARHISTFWYTIAGAAGNTTRSPNDGQGWFTPVVIGRTITVDRLGIETTAGGAGSVLRFGIYADDGFGRPLGGLVVDGGTADSSGTGDVTVTISQVLQPGIYWLCLVRQGGSAPTVRAVNGVGLGIVGGATLSTATQANLGGWNTSASSITGALPATPTLNGQAAAIPLTSYRVA